MVAKKQSAALKRVVCLARQIHAAKARGSWAASMKKAGVLYRSGAKCKGYKPKKRKAVGGAKRKAPKRKCYMRAVCAKFQQGKCIAMKRKKRRVCRKIK